FSLINIATSCPPTLVTKKVDDIILKLEHDPKLNEGHGKAFGICQAHLSQEGSSHHRQSQQGTGFPFTGSKKPSKIYALLQVLIKLVYLTSNNSCCIVSDEHTQCTPV